MQPLLAPLPNARPTGTPVPQTPPSHVISHKPGFTSSQNFTNLSETKQEPEGEFHDVLFTTIEEFDQKKKLFGANPDLNRIGRLLLPLDVFILFTEHQEISKDMESKLNGERQKLDDIIDGFLREIIMTMEKVKEVVNGKLSTYHANFANYYLSYRNKVEQFLKQSIDLVLRSETMQSYQDMRKSMFDNDPLSKEIGKQVFDLYNPLGIFMKKKEQANQIEQLFRTIKGNFKGSGVDSMTKKIDDILSSEQMALKTAEASSWFLNHQ